MRIKNITIRGFRGFNEECTIECNNGLTVIYGPNSYGKTSVSEALEWLLYGVTTKVRLADSKEEYKGSYINRHFVGPGNPFVSVTIDDHGTDVELKADLLAEDTCQRFVNGEAVDQWPFLTSTTHRSEPFVLQHALKNLLLATPDKRFIGFAQMLGLEALDQIQKDVVSLCTKPQVHITPDVRAVMNEAEALQARLSKHTALAPVVRALGKGLTGLDIAYDIIRSECGKRVAPGTQEEAVLSQLLKMRDEAVGRVFEGNIALSSYSAEESRANDGDELIFADILAEPFVQGYLSLVGLKTVNELIQKAKFFDIGVKLLSRKPDECPFCRQPIGSEVSGHIWESHRDLLSESAESNGLTERRDQILKLLTDLKERLNRYHHRQVSKVNAALELDLAKLHAILSPKHDNHYAAVNSAVSELSHAKDALKALIPPVENAITAVVTSVKTSTEDTALVKVLGENLILYLARAERFAKTLSLHVEPTADAARILKHELDAIAGTEEVSMLIDLTLQRPAIRAKLEVEAVMDGLKHLRKTIDQYVGNKVLDSISATLTSDVMTWYDLIKTSGDPDIHFGGFDMDRTVKGEIKPRRVQVKAQSYGADLVSAVSSLSESKLNALGLCMSIAANVRGESPFSFLLIDDPIQSLDSEHETQFIAVVRKLVEEHGKQVILLSHNQTWVRQLRLGCSSLNGAYYEIQGYTVQGPVMRTIPWATTQHRLQEIAAILEDQTASPIRLQHAEQEIRILVGEVTAQLYLKVKGLSKSPHNLNSAKVRKMLVECGVNTSLVDRIEQTFGTTDDAHHAPADYSAQRQRIASYRSWVQELMTYPK